MTRYRNLDGSAVDKGLLDVLRWKLSRAAPPTIAGAPESPAPSVPIDLAALAGARRSGLTWMGHASYLVQLGGVSLLVDPNWAERMLTVRRLVPTPAPLDRLPRVDAVLVTHNHRDHMDAPTLRALGAAPLYVVPKGLGRWFADAGLTRIVELGWFEHHDVGDVRVTFVPSQHWSQRGPFDRNASLWGGFVIEDGTHRVYHSGDTAYFDGFRAIGARVGRLHGAMLPIGAYEPRWFMGPQHIAPEDATRAFLDLGAERFVAMHWGTFRLTDEPTGEPPLLARASFEAHGVEPERLLVPAVGETIWL